MSEPKPYLVIARKYRPQTFDEVIGQEPIATTLKNAITLKRIGHAYLFTGPRGVGKTSMARIFAKALNCANGPTVTPCGKCPSCLEIESTRALDVLEIDGASNRGIDEIRALRESVRFAPSSGKYKVYIIDEVHQITTDGFNALLKTLEEPPAYVKFIFATTSAQKVPATILSRCQRFDFRRIATDRIVEVLREICKKEKIKSNDEALFVMAKAADGSLRDSQTILDQIAASSDNKISKEGVIQSLGVLEEERMVAITDALAKKDAPSVLTILDDLLKEGKDPVLFLEKMIEHVRNLIFLNVSSDLLDLVDATESYKKALLQQKENFSREDLFYFFSVLSHSFQTLRRFDMKRIPLEIALVKLAFREPMQNISELLEELKSAQKKSDVTIPIPERVKRLPVDASMAGVEGPNKINLSDSLQKNKISSQNDTEDDDEDSVEELMEGEIEIKPSKESRPISLDAVWQSFIQSVKSEKISIASYLAEGEPWGVKKGIATIAFPARLNFFKETLEMTDNKRLLEKHLSKILGEEVLMAFETLREIAENLSTESGNKSTSSVPIEDNPTIKSAINILGGRMVQ